MQLIGKTRRELLTAAFQTEGFWRSGDKDVEGSAVATRRKLLLQLLLPDEDSVQVMQKLPDDTAVLQATAIRVLLASHAVSDSKVPGAKLLREAALGNRLESLLLALCIMRVLPPAERGSFPGYSQLAARLSACR